VFPTICALSNSDDSAIVDAEIVAVTSKEPAVVGFALLIFDADMSSDVFVPFSLRAKLLMFMFTDLIESEVILLGRSASGIDALMPEALGISRSTLEVICDEMYCWAPTTPHKRTNTVVDAAIILIFIRIT
jgi:2-succinyl-5-enolpyruvyl-6-hydroxy-3-cyclohexene-1-carboxylate synthase